MSVRLSCSACKAKILTSIHKSRPGHTINCLYMHVISETIVFGSIYTVLSLEPQFHWSIDYPISERGRSCSVIIVLVVRGMGFNSRLSGMPEHLYRAATVSIATISPDSRFPDLLAYPPIIYCWEIWRFTLKKHVRSDLCRSWTFHM